MWAVNAVKVGVKPDGMEIMQAIVLADEVPTPIPTTGENVTGMRANQCFAPFSLLYIAGEADSKVYVANETGVFIPQ